MEIARLESGETNYQALIHRPRVSYKISEYVWKYIYENYLFKLKLMSEDKFNYHILLTFAKYNPDIHKFMFKSPYNREKCFFRPSPNFRKVKITKCLVIGLTGECVDENISSSLYASLVYDMFCAQLIVLYKKVKKEDLDKLKTGLDYEYINSFPYPAPFEEQRYMIDNQPTLTTIYDNGKERFIEQLNIKEEYLKYWGK